MKADDRTEKFAETLYLHITKKKIYITNPKYIQANTRPFKDNIFKDYLAYTLKKITILQPKHIITFENHENPILLGKSIKVSEYKEKEYKLLSIHSKPSNIPSFNRSISPSSQHKVYPVGQGMRNMPKAIARIKKIFG